MHGKVAAFLKMVSIIVATIALNSGFQLYISPTLDNLGLLLVLVVASAVACYRAIGCYRDAVIREEERRRARNEVLDALIGAPSHRDIPESAQRLTDHPPT